MPSSASASACAAWTGRPCAQKRWRCSRSARRARGSGAATRRASRAIRFFFASNAGLTIVILALIIIFLLKEGLGFFPGYRRELEIYRIAGLEFVDISRKNLTSHEQLTSLLSRAYFAQVNGLSQREMRSSQEAAALFNAFTDQIAPTRDLLLNNPQAENATNAGMCRPYSPLQGHAVWHALDAAAAYLLYRYYASEETVAADTTAGIAAASARG